MPSSKLILKQSTIARMVRAACRGGISVGRIDIDTATGKVSIFNRQTDEDTATDTDSQGRTQHLDRGRRTATVNKNFANARDQ